MLLRCTFNTYKITKKNWGRENVFFANFSSSSSHSRIFFFFNILFCFCKICSSKSNERKYKSLQ